MNDETPPRTSYPCYCLPGLPRCDDPYAWCDRANAERPPLRVVPTNYCLVHDETYDRICRGCRADYLAGEESA